MGSTKLFLYPLLLASLFCVATILPRPAHAGEPTKNEQFQPGGEGAAEVDAGQFKTLQEALDVLPDAGGVVTIPPGRYEITEPLTLSKGDVTIRGAGPSTHIANKNEDGKPALHVFVPEGKKSIWRVQICDLRVTGNPKSGAGIYAKRVDEILISRVTVEHNGADGIVLDYCQEDARVCDSIINYNKKTGLNALGCHDVVVSANQFEENMDVLHFIDGYNLTMTGNNADDHLGDGVVIENTYGSLVSANMIEECEGHAIILRGECYGDTISANTLAHCKGEGVRLVGVRDITISANTLVLLAQPAVHAMGKTSEVTITGNTFCRYPFDPSTRHKLDPACGIVLEGATDVNITGNSFTRVHESAIAVLGKGNERICVTGNSILNPSQKEPGKFAAITLENTSNSLFTNNIIADNQKKPTLKKAFEITGDASLNIMAGNIVTGIQGMAK